MKTFETEPKSSSILGLHWKVDTHSLIFCGGTEQEVPAKINHNCSIVCLSSAPPAWDMSTLNHTDAFSTQKHLGSNGASMGQRIVCRPLKLFIDWCSELREIGTMSINDFISKMDVQTSDFTFLQMHQKRQCASWHIDWCSELREIMTMSINEYFENGCSNLRLHIFTDTSEEAMCIVAYLQDEAT